MKAACHGGVDVASVGSGVNMRGGGVREISWYMTKEIENYHAAEAGAGAEYFPLRFVKRSCIDT